MACIAATLPPLLARHSAVRSHTLRLHILANSNSSVDQALKLAVRDAILEQAGSQLSGAATKEEAMQKARDALPEIRNAAQEELARHGCNDPVSVRLENLFFSTREYEGFTLPAGRYDAVRVEIGRHEGRNWFCVLFPPLCVPAALDDEAAGSQTVDGYTPQEQEAITTPYRIEFATVEIVERLRDWLA